VPFRSHILTVDQTVEPQSSKPLLKSGRLLRQTATVHEIAVKFVGTKKVRGELRLRTGEALGRDDTFVFDLTTLSDYGAVKPKDFFWLSRDDAGSNTYVLVFSPTQYVANLKYRKLEMTIENYDDTNTLTVDEIYILVDEMRHGNE